MIRFENTEVVGWEHAIRGMRNPLNSWDKSDSYAGVDCDACGRINQDGYCKPSEHRAECRKHEGYEIGPNDQDLMRRLRNAGTDHRKFLRMITVYVDITAPLYWWKEFDTYKVGTVANSCSTMHKITDKEFTLEDFSHEHLLGDYEYEATASPYLSELFPKFEEKDGDMCFWTPVTILETVIDGLNFYRRKYLETKEKPMKDGEARKALMKRYWWQMIQLLPSSYNQRRTVMLNYEVLANIAKLGSRKFHKLDEWRVDFMNWIKTLPYHELITGGDLTDLSDGKITMNEARARMGFPPIDHRESTCRPEYEHLVDVTTPSDIERTGGIRIYCPGPGCDFKDLSDSEWAAYKAGCVFDKSADAKYSPAGLKRYHINYGFGVARLVTPYDPEERFYTLADTCFGIRKSIMMCSIIRSETVDKADYERLSFNGDEYIWRRDGARKMISPEPDKNWDLDFCEECVYRGDPRV